MSRLTLPRIKPGRASALATALRDKLSATELSIYYHPLRAFMALTLLYAVAVGILSWMKLLWLDEFITLHIARLASVHDIWHALSQGADPNPPLSHIMVHFCRKLFGEHEAVLRLPAAVGYWIGCLSLFLYLRRRFPPEWALAGVLMSMSMAAFDYSYESRSYGIFYGLAMLAVLAWSITVDAEVSARTKRVALIVMTLALAGGVSTNYFAVLAVLPIAAGELTRTFNRWLYGGGVSFASFFSLNRIARSIDLKVWIGLAFGMAPLLAFRSMISRSIAQFAPHAWNKVSIDQITDSYTEMVEIILYPILFVLVLGLAIRLLAFICSECTSQLRPSWVRPIVRRMQSTVSLMPPHELASVFFLMAYPFLGYLVASVRGGMLSPRFVIPVCFGFAIAGVLATYRMLGHLRFTGMGLLCFCLAWFIARESVTGYWYMEQKQSFYKVIDRLPEADRYVSPNAPIAVPDPLMALTFQHYAPDAYKSRIVFPIDFAAIRFYRHDDSPEENIWAGRNTLYTLPVIPIAIFQHNVGNYLILANDDNWMIDDLHHHRYPVERLPINTRAGAIGGFTPLGHGTPVFFTSSGDREFYGVLDPSAEPDVFTLPGNLPSETLTSGH